MVPGFGGVRLRGKCNCTNRKIVTTGRYIWRESDCLVCNEFPKVKKIVGFTFFSLFLEFILEKNTLEDPWWKLNHLLVGLIGGLFFFTCIERNGKDFYFVFFSRKSWFGTYLLYHTSFFFFEPIVSVRVFLRYLDQPIHKCQMMSSALFSSSFFLNFFFFIFLLFSFY